MFILERGIKMENKIKALLEERRIKEKEEMKELEFKMEYLKNK